MPVSSKEVALSLIDSLRVSGQNVITIPWEEMYERCERQRLRDAFLDKLRNQLEHRNICICYGSRIVAVLPDTNFAPVE